MTTILEYVLNTSLTERHWNYIEEVFQFVNNITHKTVTVKQLCWL